MPQTASPSKIFRFGVFEVDLNAGQVKKRGTRLKVPERAFRILAVLLEKPGQVVTRDELRSHIWHGDTLVDFDHGLNNAVGLLREVLGDSSESPRYIETLPRRGYCFIAPVESVELNARPAETPLTEPPVPLADTNIKRPTGLSISRFVLPAAGVLVMAAALYAFAVRHVTGKSIAVLPFENLSGQKEQDYFADGMTDELIANLAKIRSLRVISRSTAMAYKGTHKSLSEIARELNVGAVVEGTVLRAGDRVRITAELVQVSTDHHLWAETYESQMGDILVLQNRVSSAIVDEIRLNLTTEEKARLKKAPQVSPQGYENYLKGRYYWNRRSAERLVSAIGYFQAATEQDPEYALAYAGLADCYGIISATIFGTRSPAEAAPKAKAAALRALEIDPGLAEAETALATVKFNYDWDWKAADAGFRRAIDLNPSYGTAYQRYSLYLAAMGQFRESFEQINKARDLDPLSLSVNFSLGWRLYMARQYDRAIDQLRNTLDMDQSYELPHLTLGQAYVQKGDFARAIPELRKAADLSGNTPLMVSGLAYALGVSGHKDEAETLLNKLLLQGRTQYVSPYYVAIVYAGLRRPDEATNWLDKAFADRANGVVFLKVDPQLDTLRAKKRFVDLQKRLKLPS